MRALCVATIALTAIVLACGEDRPPCYRGDFIGCTCAGDAYGYQACREQEDGYGACVCDGTTPGVVAGHDAAPEASRIALFESCTSNEECESGLCFHYGTGQSLCTVPCDLDGGSAGCPAPSPGCNGKGVCRP